MMRGEKYYTKAKLLHQKMYTIANPVNERQQKKMYLQYLRLIRLSAYSGNIEAQYDLAQQYETMNYLSVESPMYNPKKCIYWYTKACKSNHAEACNNLASFYETGEGVKKNLKLALQLYQRSAELGSALGKKNYTIMKRQMAKGLLNN